MVGWSYVRPAERERGHTAEFCEGVRGVCVCACVRTWAECLRANVRSGDFFFFGPMSCRSVSDTLLTPTDTNSYSINPHMIDLQSLKNVNDGLVSSVESQFLTLRITRYKKAPKSIEIPAIRFLFRRMRSYSQSWSRRIYYSRYEKPLWIYRRSDGIKMRREASGLEIRVSQRVGIESSGMPGMPRS